MKIRALQALGELTVTQVLYWDPAQAAYVATAPTVQQGQQVGVRATLSNGHVYASKFALNITLVAPDGSASTIDGAAQDLAAGASGTWEARWTADQAGVYTAGIGVYEYFAELAPQPWSLAGVVSVTVATATSMLQQLMPLLTGLITLGMLSGLVGSVLALSRRKP